MLKKKYNLKNNLYWSTTTIKFLFSSLYQIVLVKIFYYKVIYTNLPTSSTSELFWNRSTYLIVVTLLSIYSYTLINGTLYSNISLIQTLFQTLSTNLTLELFWNRIDNLISANHLSLVSYTLICKIVYSNIIVVKIIFVLVFLYSNLNNIDDYSILFGKGGGSEKKQSHSENSQQKEIKESSEKVESEEDLSKPLKKKPISKQRDREVKEVQQPEKNKPSPEQNIENKDKPSDNNSEPSGNDPAEEDFRKMIEKHIKEFEKLDHDIKRKLSRKHIKKQDQSKKGRDFDDEDDNSDKDDLDDLLDI